MPWPEEPCSLDYGPMARCFRLVLVVRSYSRSEAIRMDGSRATSCLALVGLHFAVIGHDCGWFMSVSDSRRQKGSFTWSLAWRRTLASCRVLLRPFSFALIRLHSLVFPIALEIVAGGLGILFRKLCDRAVYFGASFV